ncbi:MAG: GxxExxY protein [Vallitalea sp.]|jgi:GxxExxY protein|nr:GxxExxY protein [Vallitalea sp.]
MANLKYRDLTATIIKCFYSVYNELGSGFLEKVYENAFCYELQQNGLFVETQKKIHVFYKSQCVGEYFADRVVEDCIIIELKVVRKLLDQHSAQLLNYLKATSFEVGLLFNFGEDAEFKRMVLNK